jgi:hypothetical protein
LAWRPLTGGHEQAKFSRFYVNYVSMVRCGSTLYSFKAL